MLKQGWTGSPESADDLLFVPMALVEVAADRDVLDDSESRELNTFSAPTPELQRYAEWLSTTVDARRAAALRDALLELLQAPDKTAYREVVERHPELLTDEADEFLTQIIEVTEQESPENVYIAEQRRLLLRLARQQGLDMALASFAD
jgi:hypothetical protein